jgi:hypothetical protein
VKKLGTLRQTKQGVGPYLDSRVWPPNSLGRIPISCHIKMPAYIWSTKYR